MNEIMRVGILEDDVALADQLRAWFTSAGHNGFVFHDGQRMIAFLARETVDLLVLDWNVPGADGIDLVRWVRRNGDGRAGTFGGMWTAGETTGMALGATVLSIVLAVSGYVSRSAAAADAAQPGSAVAGIALGFSLVPAIIIGISLVPLARYRLRKGDIDGVV